MQDPDQDTTDLIKCIETLEEKERKEGHKVRPIHRLTTVIDLSIRIQYETLILGGFSGRLDQTIHVLSHIHKIRETRPRLYVVTDDNIGWVLDGVSVDVESWSSGLEQRQGSSPDIHRPRRFGPYVWSLTRRYRLHRVDHIWSSMELG